MLAHQRPNNEPSHHIHNQSTSTNSNRYRTSIASSTQSSSQSSSQSHHQPAELFIGTFDFETQEPDQVPFKRGAVLPIVLKEPSGWWAAQVNGRYGWVPAAFLEPWSPPQPNSGLSGASPSLSVTPSLSRTPSVSTGHGNGGGGGGQGQISVSPSSTGTGTGMRPRGSITAQSVADLPLYTEEDHNTYDDRDEDPSPQHEYYSGGGGSDNQRLSSEYTEEEPTTPGRIGGLEGTMGLVDHDHDDAEDEDDPLVSDLVAQFSGSGMPLQGAGGRRTGGSGALPPYAMYSPHSTSTNPSPTSYNNYNTFNPRNSGGNHSGGGGGGGGGGSREFYAPLYDPPIPHQLSLVLEEGSDVNSQWSMPHSSQAFSHTSSASALKKANRRGGGGGGSGEKQRYSSSLSPSGSNNTSRSPTSPSSPSNASIVSTAALHRLRIAHSSIPWYLRPKHAWDELKLDADGLVVAGTTPALIERLVMDSTLPPNQEAAFRSTMLMTYKNWTTAENLYDSLLLHYTISEPEGLGPAEALEWKEKKLRPTQMRVLCVFGLWIEKHGLMMDDPGLVPKLRTWLSTILSPTGLALSAKQLVQSIDRIQHADDPSQQSSTSPTSAFGHLGASLRRKPKPPKSDFLKWDATEVANHLTLAEARAYGRIRPCECLAWTRAGGKIKKDAAGLTVETPVSPAGPMSPGSPSGHAGNAGADQSQGQGQGAGEVRNLMAFIAKSDRLAMWVKNTVLCCESLGRRADMVDFWIKIAERCRNLNNIFSMSAIVAALSGGDVGKLHLTWAHVSRASNFEQMIRLTDPTGNFSAYRALHASLSNQPDGTNVSSTNAAAGNSGRDSILSTSPSPIASTSPTSSLSLSISTLSGRDGSSSGAGPACVPFISPFLTELMHINDQYPTTLQTPQGPEPSQAPPRPLINVVKLQRQAEVIANMLRFVDRSHLPGKNHHNCGGKGSSADGYRAIAEKENPAMVAAMDAQMESSATEARNDAGYFWKRSQELQGMEVTHADIWKNLNDAGF